MEEKWDRKESKEKKVELERNVTNAREGKNKIWKGKESVFIE